MIKSVSERQPIGANESGMPRNPNARQRHTSKDNHPRENGCQDTWNAHVGLKERDQVGTHTHPLSPAPGPRKPWTVCERPVRTCRAVDSKSPPGKDPTAQDLHEDNGDDHSCNPQDGS